MSLDILLYAIIAIILIARLWSVFGRRNDDEQQRPNPFVMPAPPQDAPKPGLPNSVPGGAKVPALPVVRSAPDSLAGGLEQIKELDPSFDEKAFLQGARNAFTMIVEDFSKGDMDRIGRLLGPHVLPHFQQSIDARRSANQTMETKISRFRDVETAAAHVEGGRATITVRFITEQENVLRDANKQIIGGEAGKVEEITDMWTFARDIKSGETSWILSETHS